MTLFNSAFTFTIDPSAVNNSPTASIAALGLYFMFRPNSQFNLSGLDTPGITLYITDTINDVPNVTNPQIFFQTARCEWEEISTSSDATSETQFKFVTPIVIIPGKKYAAILNYDANEAFVPWLNRRGFKLVGTQNVSSGPSQAYGGAFFAYNAAVQDFTNINANDLANLWTPMADTDIKFKVYVAKYTKNGVPVFATNNAANSFLSPSSLIFTNTNNSITVIQPSPRIEYVTYDTVTSLKQAFVGPQRISQVAPYYPGNSVYATVISTQSDILTANPTYTNGVAFSWSSIFGSYSGEKYITIYDYTGCDIRKIVSNTSANSTVIQLDEPTTFINSSARFTLGPVATVDGFNTSFLTGQSQGLLILRDSNANSSNRFVSDAVDPYTTTITANGGGYSNNDRIFVFGYDNIVGKVEGNYPAIIGVTTNASGNLVNLNYANLGAGFSNTSNIKLIVANSIATVNSSSTNSSAGSGLAINVAIGTTLFTEQNPNIFKKCKFVDIGLSDMYALSNVQSAANTTMNTNIITGYYTEQDNTVPSGYVSYVGEQSMSIALNQTIDLGSFSKTPVLVSRSNEFNVKYSNGNNNPIVNALVNYSNNICVSYNVSYPNEYTLPVLNSFTSPVLNFGRYYLNNDDTGENTNFGNALARIILTNIQFQGQINANTQCEDVRVYITGYRPSNTDIKVYARIQNKYDPEAFDDEDWTLLQMIGNSYSSGSQIELTYGFYREPNTSIMIGTVSTINASANVTGDDTDFSDLVEGDFVKIYDPLQPNDNFVIAMVNSTPTDNTTLIVNAPFSTNTEAGIGGFELTNVLGMPGLGISKVTYPNQAYTYPQNFNVVQYYNLGRTLFQQYSTLQLKILLLSPTFKSLPHISSVRAIGLSA